MNFESITIILLIVGISAIFFSYYHDKENYRLPSPKINDEINQETSQDYYEEYGARIEELNKKIHEINEYGEFMKSELDKKHKELLFLYQMIHEKTKELYVEDKIAQEEPIPKKNIEHKARNNYNQMRLDFYNKGYNKKEIAQLLDIGQGEVTLVIELYERNKKNETR